jgi:hypothetical protein
VFFGGARGGGKTDGVLGKYGLKAMQYGAAFNALFCRRELPMLDDAIERSRQIYGPLGAHWSEQAKTWRFPEGGRLRFRPLERLDDADKYQGQNISDVCIEEAGQYPDSRPIDRLHAVLRSASGIPTQLLLTGNPGGAGQAWIRARYIDPAPKGWEIINRHIDLPAWAGGGTVNRKAVFIPSRVSDNRFLGREYVAGLHLVGSAALVRAWVDGDWNAIEGAFFDCWDNHRHVVAPFAIPEHWTRFRSFDWGFAAPFSVGWWAVASESTQSNSAAPRAGRNIIPRGAFVRYREWYGSSEPNVGIRLEAEQIAAGILERDKGEHINYGVADTAIFDQAGKAYGYSGPTIAERMGKAGVIWNPADKSRQQGWDQMRARLTGDIEGDPMLVVFSTCVDFIRTVPMLQHDMLKPEDLDTAAEDHVADEARYGCMSRPWTKQSPQLEPPLVNVATPTLADLVKRTQRRRSEVKRI